VSIINHIYLRVTEAVKV